MKIAIRYLLATAVALTVAAPFQSVAQGDFNVTQVTADPNTKLFSDGRHTVAAYVVSQLQERTNCCGADDITLEIRYDVNGFVTSTRVLQGSNECNRQMLPEIVKYIRFSVSDPTNLRPVYLPLRPVVECRGAAQDNQVMAYAAPAGWVGPSAATVAAAQQPAQPAQQRPAAQPPVQQQRQPPSQPAQPRTVESHTVAGAQDPKPDSLIRPAVLPAFRARDYRAIDRRSNPELRGNHQNVAGPTNTVRFKTNAASTAIYIKKKMREQGVCDQMAHFLVELELDSAGTVRGLRYLAINDSALIAPSSRVLSAMRFEANTATAARRVFSMLEFKTFVDCVREDKQDLDQVADFIIGPGDQGQRLNPNMQQNEAPQQRPANTPIGLPTDR